MGLSALLINSALFPIHVSSGNDPNQRFRQPQRERDVQQSVAIGFAQRVIPCLKLAVLCIVQNGYRNIGKNLLRLCAVNVVLLIFVALSSFHSHPVNLHISIMHIYRQYVRFATLQLSVTTMV